MREIKINKSIVALTISATMLSTGCATLTNDPNIPVAFSFSDRSEGDCNISNKRGAWKAELPETVMIRRSSDDLVYHCETDNGDKAHGRTKSKDSGKVFGNILFGGVVGVITDAATDKSKVYPPSIVIPVGGYVTPTVLEPAPVSKPISARCSGYNQSQHSTGHNYIAECAVKVSEPVNPRCVKYSQRMHGTITLFEAECNVTYTGESQTD